MTSRRARCPPCFLVSGKKQAAGKRRDRKGIEEGTLEALIGSIQKFSTEDGPGIRTTVFLKGCPLNCRWCHNPELIDPEQELIRVPGRCIHCGYCMKICPEDAVFVDEENNIDIRRDRCTRCMRCADECWSQALKPVSKKMTVREVYEEALQDRSFYQHTGGGITISGGELLLHREFVEELIDMGEKDGIDFCLDTSGYGDGEFLFRMASRSNVSNILFDIKAMDDRKHQELTGVSNEPILKNLRRLAEDPATRRKIHLRMPLIAGLNDGDEDIQAVAREIEKLGITQVTILPYHDFGISKKRNIGGMQERFSPPAEARLEEIRRALEKTGAAVNISGTPGK
ncbi:MAG: glycyl-radical enzyme activating protein [Mobilibacterium timonense]|nr:glycyl-radical enzyme activating protein [Mobilibacterium timonense]